MRTKICKRCNKEKLVSEFHKDGSSRCGLNKYCKCCKSEYGKKHYNKYKGAWLYYITINGVIRWVGSTTNLYKRLNKHKNAKRRGNIIYESELRGINNESSNIEVYVCDTKKIGLNLTKKDLEYYEHILIRRLKQVDIDYLFNRRTAALLELRERYIDEVPLEKFIFNKYTKVDI